jgi:DNA-binding transcriptional regulator GbsR (MarR family)
MIDFKTAQVRRHQQNLERYCRLLATELTNLQRQYLHKRIAEEYAQLKRLEKAAFRATAWQDDTRVEQMASSSGLAKVSASPASKLGTKPEIHHGVAGSPSGLRC